VASGKCFAAAAASCGTDGHTLTSPSGHAMDCAPYACSGTMCRSACSSVLDCVYPAECSPDGKCLAGVMGASPSSSGGCGCKTTTAGGSEGALAAVAASCMLLVRRRRRFEPRRGHDRTATR
jgi:MYXO-CTERM domain-containing protein